MGKRLNFDIIMFCSALGSLVYVISMAGGSRAYGRWATSRIKSRRTAMLSTCGLVPEMYRLAEEGLAVTLALSLHASSQEKRRSLMPVANKYSLPEVLDACRYYYEQTGRRITFEYSLVGGVNDSTGDAQELAKLVKPLHGHVNLIPVNPIKERDYVQSGHAAVVSFKNKLEKSGINVTIRREIGRDIDGACGQLRKSYMDTEK